MNLRHVVITGGAGFVGGNLGRMLKASFPELTVTAFDNLTRRGTELGIEGLGAAGVSFVHGDVRCPEDFDALGDVDLLIDCAAEPSVLAGLDGAPAALLRVNLTGTLNCLELARTRGAAFLFLSTSRVYPLAGLDRLPWDEDATRYLWPHDFEVPGFSARGIAETFPLEGARSLYGASKLAAELVLTEYVHSYGLRALIDRCSVIAGPGQLGRVDQGVVALWAARHVYNEPLRYIGYGGSGKQVRDVLHVRDLFELVVRQMEDVSRWDGSIYNVGGGADRSTSLRELTTLCRTITGNAPAITVEPRTRPVDVRIFITDCARVEADYDWKPQRSVQDTVTDVVEWIRSDAERLRPVLAC